MWRRSKAWLRELRLKIRDQIELHRPLPGTVLQLKQLYERKRQEYYCAGVLARINKEWWLRSSIELVVASTNKENWRGFYYACKNCPPDHVMREDMIYLLMRKSATEALRRKAAALLSDSMYTKTSLWENEGDKPWQS